MGAEAQPRTARLRIADDADIVQARHTGRSLAQRVGCTPTEQTEVATAISELARNLVSHANGGEMVMEVVVLDDRHGVQIVASDDGPGIADLERAMEDGFSTDGGLGLGLPGTRRLMDEFDIDSAPGRGTTVTIRKWGGHGV